MNINNFILMLNNQDNENDQGIKRKFIRPEKEDEKLQPNEIGIRSNLKGTEIRDLVDRALYKLLDRDMRTIVLKGIGNI